MDGDHTIDKYYDVTSRVLAECYKELDIHNVNLEEQFLNRTILLVQAANKKLVQKK